MESIKLNTKQLKALELLKDGYNVFLTGPGGTGKSTVIKIFKQWCENNYRRIAITSTTGVSALLINGTTIHSFAGIRTGEDPVDKLIEGIKARKFVNYRWRATKVLVIDEISMMKPELLEKLDSIGKAIRNNPNPFGGLQVVLTGDFAQLPPVYIDEEEKFCFQSPLWKTLVQKTVHLTEIMRQKDKIFQRCLSEIRLSNVSETTLEILQTRLVSTCQIQKINGILPTRLFARKRNVEEINNKHLQRLRDDGAETVTFEAETKVINTKFQKIPDSYKDGLIKKINRSCPAPDKLELVVGAQVMLNYNYCIEDGLVNGSRGVLSKIIGDVPVVRFLDGAEIPIAPVVWELREDDSLCVQKKQIPLIVAYACTIHKVQGATLDLAIIDAGPNIFQYGQIYTALSRVKSLDGLYLLKLDPERIRCHPKVLEFYGAKN